jgi:hypothetical protein
MCAPGMDSTFALRAARAGLNGVIILADDLRSELGALQVDSDGKLIFINGSDVTDLDGPP